jgi:glycyl-tRNA synthetase beta subunit
LTIEIGRRFDKPEEVTVVHPWAYHTKATGKELIVDTKERKYVWMVKLLPK